MVYPHGLIHNWEKLWKSIKPFIILEFFIMKSATPLTSTSENAFGPQYMSEHGSLLAPSSNDKKLIGHFANSEESFMQSQLK